MVCVACPVVGGAVVTFWPIDEVVMGGYVTRPRVVVTSACGELIERMR